MFDDDKLYPWISDDATKDRLYKIRVNELSPTQFASGRAEVMVKAARMARKYEHDPKNLQDYLRMRPVPIVIHEGKHYLVDHHHLVRALHEALHQEHGDDLRVVVTVLANLSGIDRFYFWKQMYEKNLVYLFDQHGGGPQQPEQLPATIAHLAFDPYRSLAWIVRDRHGYLKNDAPFSEFKWANFFRTRILLDEFILAGKHTFDDFAFKVSKKGTLELTGDGKEIVDEAMFLALSAEARGLPGYRGPAGAMA